MTNGEKFKKIFKISQAQVDEGELYAYVWLPTHDAIEIPLEWWNAEYKEPTTKNNLGVDWESYKDIDGNSLDDLILEVLQNNFDCGNTYGYKVADEIIGLLPSVTPQEPKPMVEIDLDYVIKQKYIEREVLDKLTAEIETKYGQCDICEYDSDYCGWNQVGDIADILQIIDRYKAETEDN